MSCATGWRNAESHNRKTSLHSRGRLRAAFFFEVTEPATGVQGKPSLALFTGLVDAIRVAATQPLRFDRDEDCS
jgi:hypothetical protein